MRGRAQEIIRGIDFRSGCALSEKAEITDLFVTFNAVEDESNENAALTGETLLKLTELLYSDIAKADRMHGGRDPQ